MPRSVPSSRKIVKKYVFEDGNEGMNESIFILGKNKKNKRRAIITKTCDPTIRLPTGIGGKSKNMVS